MTDIVVKLTSSRGFQDVGTIGQTTAQLSGNVQSINAVIDVGLRNTRNIGDSFVRVQDLVDMGIGTLDGNQFFVTPSSGGGSGTVHVQYSIIGDGSVSTPLQLDGDAATPGNSKYYGTDSGGIKGFFTLPSGLTSPLTTKGDVWGYSSTDARIPVGSNGQVLTADSTQTLGLKWAAATSVTTKGDIQTYSTTPDRLPVGSNTQILSADSTTSTGLKWVAAPSGVSVTTKGDLQGYDSAANRIPVGSNGQVLTADSTQALGVKWAPTAAPATETPGTIPDLVLWFETDDVLATTGVVSRLRERTPYITGAAANAIGSGFGALVDATPLYGLNTLAWPNAGSGLFTMPGGFSTPVGMTFFFVGKGQSGAAAKALLAGTSTNGSSIYISNGGGVKAISLVKEGVGNIATCTTAWTTNTYFQMNVTYNPTSGAFAFRQARAAANSGTGTTGANAVLNTIGGDQFSSNFDGSIAAMIVYNRVLSGPEIASIEAYLLAKWGV